MADENLPPHFARKVSLTAGIGGFGGALLAIIVAKLLAGPCCCCPDSPDYKQSASATPTTAPVKS